MDNNTLMEALVALKPFLSKVEDNAIAISSIDNRLALLIEETRKLSRILYEGNGQPPLTTRMATIETSLVLVKDMVTDQKKEEKEALARLLNHIQTVDKASIELGIAFDDFQTKDTSRRQSAEAKELVNYGWKLNALQAVGLLIFTSIVSFVGSELYSNWQRSQPSMKGIPPTGTASPHSQGPTELPK